MARKGAGEAFDRLLEADARWRELIPQVDELRGRQKIQGRPTPEQVEELKQVKEQLRALEDELAAAEAARDEVLQQVPNPPHESVPDAEEEDSEGRSSVWSASRLPRGPSISSSAGSTWSVPHESPGRASAT